MKIRFPVFLMMVLLFIIPVSLQAASKSLTFQWQQDTMAQGDKWELWASEQKGGPYLQKVADIPFVSDQANYQQTVPDLTIPDGGYYFVLKKIRADGDVSAWSNEVYFKPTAGPYNLKLIIGAQP